MREVAVIRAALMLSWIMGAMPLAAGILYAGPEVLVRRPLPPGQETIVVVVEHFFPVWPFLFATAGIWIGVAAFLRRGLLVAHGVAIAVWGFYGLCLVLAPLRSIPPSPILFGVIACLLALANWRVMRLWAALGVK